MIGGIVVVLHVEPRGLVLEQIAEVVDETLGEHVIVDGTEGCNNTVGKKYTTHGKEISNECGGIASSGDPLLNTVDKEFEEIKVNQRKHALEDLIDEMAQKRAWVAGMDH